VPDELARATCAVESARRAEPLVATASRVRSWLLIEQAGAWGRDALVESDLDREVAAILERRCRDEGVGPLLIRRPGWRRPDAGHRCYLAYSGSERSWLVSLELDQPSDLLDIDLALLADERRPELGQVEAAPVFLVCTNGRHDRCCAEWGRPLARALAAAGVPDVWECSHIGGDRFAATLVCLPEGLYYGRVGPEEGPALAADHARGLLTLDRYRGRSCYPPLVQAAEQFARQASGIREVEGLVVAALEWPDHDTVVVTFAATVPARGRAWRARVVRRRSSTPVALTCHSDQPSLPWEYVLEDVEGNLEG
jgi:hypothetical protein